MSTYCTCGKHQLTTRETLLLAPGETPSPPVVNCPECGIQFKATKASKNKYAAISIGTLIGTGAILFQLDSDLHPATVIAASFVAGSLLYFGVWPKMMKLEE